jgi:hypothetical protein
MTRRKGRWHGIRFVALPSEWFWGTVPDFLELSPAARLVYFCIKSGYIPGKNGDPGNNGQITFTYSALMKSSGFSSHTTIWRAIKELRQKGWIHRKKIGGLYEGSNEYELTGKYDPCL